MHQETDRLLRLWAAGSHLVRADFFYYYLGKIPEQKSDEGLLRAVLFQILNVHEDSVESVLTTMWQEALFRKEETPLEVPTLSTMREALKAFCTHRLNGTMRLFLVVNGLDESSSNHTEGTVFFLQLAAISTNVKILLSSIILSRLQRALFENPATQWIMENHYKLSDPHSASSPTSSSTLGFAVELGLANFVESALDDHMNK
jgi:hypothetical protein